MKPNKFANGIGVVSYETETEYFFPFIQIQKEKKNTEGSQHALQKLHSAESVGKLTVLRSSGVKRHSDAAEAPLE